MKIQQQLISKFFFFSLLSYCCITISSEQIVPDINPKLIKKLPTDLQAELIQDIINTQIKFFFPLKISTNDSYDYLTHESNPNALDDSFRYPDKSISIAFPRKILYESYYGSLQVQDLKH